MKLLTSLCSLALLTASAFATKQGWTDDFERARAQAEAENKEIILDFTGSDWCEWCEKLEKDVFSKPEFKEYAAKHYVLVEVDFPLSFNLPDAIKKQNEMLQQKYGVEHFPTVVVISPGGTKRREFTYVPGGPDAFIKELEKAK